MLTSVVNSSLIGLLGVSELSVENLFKQHPTLNYLMDGLLVQYLHRPPQSTSAKTLFMTQSFGHPFFLGHYQTNQTHDKNQLKEVKQILDIFAKFASEKTDRVMVIASSKETGHDLIQKIAPQFKNLKFLAFPG